MEIEEIILLWNLSLLMSGSSSGPGKYTDKLEWKQIHTCESRSYLDQSKGLSLYVDLRNVTKSKLYNLAYLELLRYLSRNFHLKEVVRLTILIKWLRPSQLADLEVCLHKMKLMIRALYQLTASQYLPLLFFFSYPIILEDQEWIFWNGLALRASCCFKIRVFFWQI